MSTLGDRCIPWFRINGHAGAAESLLFVAILLWGNDDPLFPATRIERGPSCHFEPVGLVAVQPFVLAVSPRLPIQSLKDLIALARAKPGSLSFGSSGTGGVPHLATELLRQMSKTQMTHVPYKGDAPAITDLLGGQIQVFMGGPLVVQQHINAGKLRGLAVTSAKRSEIAPDLPPMAEAGNLPGYEVQSWTGYMAPAKTPPAVLERLERELLRVLLRSQRCEIADRLRTLLVRLDALAAHFAAQQAALRDQDLCLGNSEGKPCLD